MGCGQSEADDTSAHDETNDAAPSSTNPSTHDGSDSSTRGPETTHEICEVKVAAGLASIAATDRGLGDCGSFVGWIRASRAAIRRVGLCAD